MTNRLFSNTTTAGSMFIGRAANDVSRTTNNTISLFEKKTNMYYWTEFSI